MEEKEYIEIKIGDETYKCLIALTEEEKRIGLSETKSLEEDEGLLFVYDEPQKEVTYQCRDMVFPIDIIFIGEDAKVISVYEMEAHDPLEVSEKNVQFVLEVNADSDIEEGDTLEGDLWEDEEDDDSLTDDEKEEVKSHGKMLVLDENGDVQMKLEGGERICSIISTRKLIKAAVKAYRSDNDSDYKKVGKIILKELIALDKREPVYTLAPK